MTSQLRESEVSVAHQLLVVYHSYVLEIVCLQGFKHWMLIPCYSDVGRWWDMRWSLLRGP